MKHTIKVLGAATLGLSCATPGSAQTRPGLEVGVELFNYGYRERVDRKVVARDLGTFGGATLTYVETIGVGTFLRGRFSVDFGSTEYRSPSLGIFGPADEPAQAVRFDGVSQNIGQLELQLGHDFALADGVTLSPFVGIAARVLNDESGKKRDLGGYDRQINYSYLPVGVVARAPIGGRTALLLSGQYNQVLSGEARSYFSKIDPDIPDLKLRLKSGSGLEASVLVEHSFARRAISIGPFVRRWTLGRSKTLVLRDPEGSGETLEFYEPKNATTEFGLRLSLSF